MARTGLRMPTFPSPSLKFRTAGFPRYGFKASLSGRAFPNLAEVKPAPGMPVSTPGLHRPFARFHPRTLWPGTVSRPGRASASRCAGGPWPPYPRGPWLRSEFCCLGPSSRTTTPSAGLAGTRRLHDPAAYTPRLRCAGAPRRPARPSLLSRPCCPCVPSTLRRWVRDALPLCRRRDTRLPRPISESPPTSTRLCQQYPTGLKISALHRSRHAAARVFARSSWLATTRCDHVPRTSPAEVPCHSRFRRRPSPGSAGSQARGANGKSPLVWTFTRPVHDR